VALLIRSAVLVPLGVIIPPLRRLVWERASALSINPDFRRRPPEGDFARMVFWQELGASVWALALLASTQVWAGAGWRSPGGGSLTACSTRSARWSPTCGRTRASR
jgi:hypothetical protein